MSFVAMLDGQDSEFEANTTKVTSGTN
eukprot:SAG11_NODE_25059_length_364_cov_0.875472_1_plen_26_part_01